MTEEQVTKAILQWLLSNNWKIICYDFPQSGTGKFLHPNDSKEKNKDTINPDIVAVRDDKCLFFENKGYFYFPDFQKVQYLRTTNDYSNAIGNLLAGYNIRCIKYGIGYPSKAHKAKAKKSAQMVDFIVGVDEENNVEILYSADGNFF